MFSMSTIQRVNIRVSREKHRKIEYRFSLTVVQRATDTCFWFENNYNLFTTFNLNKLMTVCSWKFIDEHS